MIAQKISIIVPVYNVELFLRRCVESLIDQTYKNIEIILVDDGSTDNSGKICDSLKKKDNRIKVIHQKNAGLSGARNTGIEMCSGRYIFFVDSDDWINPATLELLYRTMSQTNSDIVECAVRCIHKNIDYYDTNCDGKKYTVQAVDAIRENLKWGMFKPMAWNKLYKREVIGDIRFPIGKYHEDEFTTHKFYYGARKITLLNIALYNYDCTRESSITNNFTTKNLDACEAFRSKTQFIVEHDDLKEILQLAGDVYYFTVFSCLSKAYKKHIQTKKIKAVVRETIETSNLAEICNVDENYKKYLSLLKINPRVCSWIWCRRNKKWIQK